MNCLEGTCNECGISEFIVTDQMKGWTKKYTWFDFIKEGTAPRGTTFILPTAVGVGKFPAADFHSSEEDVAPQMNLQQKLIKSTLSELHELITARFPEFAIHVHTWAWQHHAYKECIDVMPLGTVVVLMDYSENYSDHLQKQLQAQYWYPSSYVLMPVIVMYRDP
eukprot:2892391-Prorocentrum_lima.AAC.1